MNTDKIYEILSSLNELKHYLEDPDGAIAEFECDDDETLEKASELLVYANNAIEKAIESVELVKMHIELFKEFCNNKNVITPEVLEEMAAIASEFDASGDPMLVRQASVLDEILLTIGASADAIFALKKAKADEINRLREKYKNVSQYTDAKKYLDEANKVAETAKLVKEQIKEYRPLEAALSTRTCPDHPGAQMSRITDRVYQCSLDKHIYDFESGYVTTKGNKVPGTSVSGNNNFDNVNNDVIFNTRENRLNN